MEYGNTISQRRTRTTGYLHFDGLVSTRRSTDARETFADTWLYTAWGDTLQRTGTPYIPL